MKNIYEILSCNPVVVAPMAGFTDLYFRNSLRKNGAFLTYTEMVSAKALCFKDKKTYDILKTSPDDTPLCVQIFGHEPDVMREGALIIENMGFEMIDINCGCPAPKVYKNGDGSALMLNPRLIYQIVHEIRKSVKTTLSVKLRIGYDWEHNNVLECAKMCQEGGADFVTIHGRTRDMQYSGKCDISYIKKVKDELFIPVIGNGDVIDRKSYLNMRAQTNCDGVMVGRAALGNPFIVKEILNENYKATKEEALCEMMCHIKELSSDNPDGIRTVRALMLYYMNKFSFSREMKFLCAKANSLDDVKEIVKRASLNE